MNNERQFRLLSLALLGLAALATLNESSFLPPSEELRPEPSISIGAPIPVAPDEPEFESKTDIEVESVKEVEAINAGKDGNPFAMSTSGYD